MKRIVVGIQTHHSLQLNDAVRGITIACAGLRGAAGLVTKPEELQKLLYRATVLARDISVAEQAARRRLQELYLEDPETFRACRDGHCHWPDETAEGFIPRCSCEDKCLVHDHGLRKTEWAARYPDAVEEQCNCGEECPAHDRGESA